MDIWAWVHQVVNDAADAGGRRIQVTRDGNVSRTQGVPA